MTFDERASWLRENHRQLLERKNIPIEGNGVYERYVNPILTVEHTPLEWRYDFDRQRNPYLMERIGMHATLNSGAIKWNGKYVLVVRVEGNDRKSFFAVAESPNGVDNFRFWPRPITMPEWGEPATNVYDMRLTAHEDGWIADPDGRVLIYYASSDTRMHVATSSVDRLVDYCLNTPEDGLRTALSVETLNHLVAANSL